MQPKTVRIGGLVRAARALAAAAFTSHLSEEDVLALRQRRTQVLDEVERILHRHGAQEAALAAPSRRALQTLRNMRFAATPFEAPAPESIRFANLTAFVDGLHNQIWQAAVLNTPEAVAPQVSAALSRIETALGRKRVALPAGQMQQLAWLRWLNQPAHLASHVDTLSRLRRLGAGSLAHAQLAWGRSLYAMKPSPTGMRLTLAQAFAGAPDDVLKAVLALLKQRNSAARGLMYAYAESAASTKIVSALRALSEPAVVLITGPHDLAASFARVNATYFAGVMPQPRLTWSTSANTRLMGQYQPGVDTLMLNCALNTADVPQFVIDYVMYHELLHKQLGARITRGKRHVHFAEFRTAEQRFPQFAEANAILNKLARG